MDKRRALGTRNLNDASLRRVAFAVPAASPCFCVAKSQELKTISRQLKRRSMSLHSKTTYASREDAKIAKV
jgi:hypothetical protein